MARAWGQEGSVPGHLRPGLKGELAPSQPCLGRRDKAIARPRGRSGRRQPALTFRKLGHHFSLIFL